MEFELDVWNGISTFYASTGRQLGENNAMPAAYKEVVETEHKRSTFAGSRFGRQMNMSALRHVIPVWDDVLQLTTLLRNHFVEHHGIGSGAMNPLQSYVFSKIGAGYLAFMARRTRHPLKNGSVTPTVTGFFTLGVGPFVMVRALMEKGDLAALERSPLSADEWYALAESSGSLLAGNDRACAGTRKMITEFIDVAINGSYDKPLASVEAERAFACIDDWSAFYQYLYASSRLELLIKLNQALTARALLALRAADDMSDTDRSMLQDALALCFHKVESSLDDRTLLSRFTTITLALLEELKYPAVSSSLARAGVLAEADAFEAADGDVVPVALRHIRLTTALIYPYCTAELASIHESLGRATTHPIALDDLYDRVAGPQLRPLLASLARADLTRPAETSPQQVSARTRYRVKTSIG